MAFKQVFYALREVFPQIDLRILKAVASQYSSDVDAAVEFVLSDVLPAVSEPTEAHYTLQDIGHARNDHTDFWSSGTVHERNISPGYHGPICAGTGSEKCSLIEDKVVINETITTPTVDNAQVEASSTSASKPPIIDYEQSGSATFVDYCAMDKGKMTLQAEDIATQKHLNDNYSLPDSFVSSESTLLLYKQSPSDSAVKCKGKVPLRLPKAERIQDSGSQDKYNLGNLFANFSPTGDEHTSVNSLGVFSVNTFDESGDNCDFQVLIEKETPLKLSEAETVRHSSKSEDNYNLDTLFVGLCSNEDGERSDSMLNAPTFQALFKSEDTYDMQVLPEKGMPLQVSAAQRIHDISKSQDNYDSQVLFENIDNAEKELDMLRTAESTPELNKSEDDLYQKSCAADSNAQVFKEKDNSFAVGSEDQPSTDFTNPGTLTSICNLKNDFDLPELFCSTQNVSLSDLDSACEGRTGAEEEAMCLSSVDKQSVVPFIVHDSFPGSDIKLTHKHEEFLDITTRSYQIVGMDNLVSDITNGKEALRSLYDSTIIKTKEVELQEGTSRKIKQDATKARQDIVAMVEKFNQLIKNANESNDKQAQIVREEKSLLAALAQDLQSRLTKLSAERCEALAIVEEIKLELDARLATLTEEEAAAREQISQEEKIALLVRKEKETELGCILEESKMLQKEAEENLLLRDFLSGCGSTIDILEGEISSIHEKAVVLKERTHRSKLQSALVTTSSSATSSPVGDCKTLLTDRHQPLKDQNKPLKNQNSNDLQPKIAGSRAIDQDFSDEEWEMLETTQEYN
ncbi:hypothetical protein U9M48_019896 [Paspalum notatum var. saurae]|uniref:CUE domain-containing protein n=1 Tax=Paspalum notatum var. saurae TaxID=547442 RepID=A0AAQ3TC88_PASNO